MLKPPSNRGKARMSRVVSSFFVVPEKVVYFLFNFGYSPGGEVYDCSSIAEGGC